MTIRLFAVRIYEKRKFYLYKYERSKKKTMLDFPECWRLPHILKCTNHLFICLEGKARKKAFIMQCGPPMVFGSQVITVIRLGIQDNLIGSDRIVIIRKKESGNL